MADTAVDALIFDLLIWLRAGERSYDDVMELWRTSCPKLPVWEDASDRGFIAREQIDGHTIVCISPAGREFLERHLARSI